MKIIFGSFVALIGAGLLFLGLMFLIAAKGSSTRQVTAVVLLIIGVLVLISGIRLFLQVFWLLFSPYYPNQMIP